MKRLLATVAISTLLASGGALAQTAATTDQATTAETGGALHVSNLATMRETVETELAQAGVTVEVGALTLDQLSEVLLILHNDSLTVQERHDELRQLLEAS
jgi:hypothetical protein